MKYHHAADEVAPFPEADSPSIKVWWCEDFDRDCTHVEIYDGNRVVWTGTEVSADYPDAYAFASEITEAELQAARKFYRLKEE